MAELRSPIMPADLAALAVLSDAQISPDGSRVAYPVRRMDLTADRYRAAIQVATVDGSADPTLITAGDDDAGAPRWSPDGLTIAYLSAGVPSVVPAAPKAFKQVHLVPAGGGAPRRLTDLGADCAEPAWSPDGSGLVVAVKDSAAPVHPADPAPADGGIRVYDRLRYQSDEAGLLDLRRTHLWWMPLAGESRHLTDGDWNDSQPAFSPDGREIAFASNRSARRDQNTVSDLWVVGREGGECRRITDEHGTYGNPSWSPDGRWVTGYGVARARGTQVANVRLWRFPAAGGEGSDLLGSWDRTVGSVINSDLRGQAPPLPPTWSADGTRVYFIGSDQGTANLYSCASTGGGVRAVTLGAQHLVGASINAAAGRFAAVVATAVAPGEVVSGTLDSAELRQLTRLNEPFLTTHFVAEPERVEFTGADGWTIEGWLLKPRGFDPARSWPLVLEIHGGPHTAYGHSYFHEFQVLAGRGYAVLYTNPRGSQAYGERFALACVGDWGGKDHEDLMAGVDHALGLGWIDPDRLYLTGGSYGGFMTNWIVGHTDRFKAAVTQRSISNHISAFGTSDIGWHFWEDEMGDATPWRDAHKLVERSPLTHVTEIHTPLLILHAENDHRCPIEQAEQLFVALQVLGREATFVRYPTDTHELTRSGKPTNRIDHCRRIVDWFDAHP